MSGYPVKAKLFKSPQEFAVHMIWLLSNSKDYSDCCCVHCNTPIPAKSNPATDETLVITPSEPIVQAPPKVEKQVPKITPVPLPPIPGQSMSKPAVAPAPKQVISTVPKQMTAVPPPRIPNMPSVAIQSMPTPTTQPTPVPTPIPAPVPTAVPKPLAPLAAAPLAAPVQPKPPGIQWILKANLLFRIGELVWYQTGNTWRLGIIAGLGVGVYEMLPIGHGLVPQQNVSKPESDLRPFHCFSVPSVDIAELKEKVFDDVVWETMFRSAGSDKVRRDLTNLDASKMAASKIDYSFSLWTRRSEDPNAKNVTYYGCFFGAERIEIGDCLRLKAAPDNMNTASQTAVLGLCYIVTTGGFPGAVFFRGHIYQLTRGGAGTAGAVPDENLPVALRDEIQWRHQVNPAQRWCWLLVKENAVLKEQFIRGRFYPTHRLMPVHNPAGFRAMVSQGQLEDQHVYLNNRMDGGGRYLGRKKNRLDTLGPAVPHGARLSMEPYIIEEQF